MARGRIIICFRCHEEAEHASHGLCTRCNSRVQGSTSRVSKDFRQKQRSTSILARLTIIRRLRGQIPIARNRGHLHQRWLGGERKPCAYPTCFGMSTWRSPSHQRRNKTGHYFCPVHSRMVGKARSLGREPKQRRPTKIEMARRRLRWLRTWMSLCPIFRRAGRTKADAAASVIAQCRRDPEKLAISNRTLQKWSERFRVDGINGLMDKRGGAHLEPEAASAPKEYQHATIRSQDQ